jgi:hypothetical protein
VGLLALVSLARTSQAADFACPAGDVACLIAAINTANANGEANTIRLKAGTYTLTAVDNDTDGPNGLPSVTSTLTLQGTGADATSIAREGSIFSPPFFRLLHVAATGRLTLKRLTLRGGVIFSGPGRGGGIYNAGGIVTVTHSTLVGNDAPEGGGIYNAGGIVTVTHSTLRDNGAGEGGGFANVDGRITITHSTIGGSNGGGEDGGGFANRGGMVTVTHSTIADNAAHSAGAIFTSNGTVTITDSTIVGNRSDSFTGSGIDNGGFGNGGFLTILNSTIARNVGGVASGILNGGQLLMTVGKHSRKISDSQFLTLQTPLSSSKRVAFAGSNLFCTHPKFL